MPPPPSTLEALLQRGLDFYALNNAEEAARCWDEAARLDPSDSRASEYLSALRGDRPEEARVEPASLPTPPPSAGWERRRLTGLRQVVNELGTSAAPRAFNRDQFIELLQAKKFEEALETLYRMRTAAPDNASVSKGIQVLKEKLLSDALERLGNLDQLAVVTSAVPSTLSDDEAEVLRLVDGIASLGDLLSASRLGRFTTARVLAALLQRGAIRLDAAPGLSAPPPVAPPPEPAPVVEPPPAEPPPDVTQTTAPMRSYDSVFRLATEAYLRRDVETALSLFERCLRERPDDRRVQHNIERLQQRKRKS